MNLILPSPDENADFRKLTAETRSELRAWHRAFTTLMEGSVTRCFRLVAQEMGSTPGTVKRYYYACKKAGNYWPIVNKTKEGLARSSKPIASREFASYLAKRVEENQRVATSALRMVIREWKAGKKPPGYEAVAWTPELPEGWSTGNLARIAKKESDRLARLSISIGTSSKTVAGSLLPQVLTTREGLWAGAVYQIDDVWHDNVVTIGNAGKPTRVLQLGALDLLSGCYVHSGMKPRMPKAEGGSENLRAGDARLFIAGLLSQVGYSGLGTTIMAEHGTAAIEERVEELLYNATGGKVRVRRQPIEGKQMALCNYWTGSEGGNFRAKAALESWHNLLHNELAHLPGQTGLDPAHRPIETDRMQHYVTKIFKEIAEKNPSAAHLLRLPILDFHTEFVPMVYEVIANINARTDHRLEGWSKFKVREYTTLPGSGHFMSEDEFLSLPDNSRAIISAAAREDAAAWTRQRNMSPAEVWSMGANKMRTIPEHVVCDILGEDLAREEVVKGSYFRFTDQDLGPEDRYYSARIRTPDGLPQVLRAGEKYQVLPNPFCPTHLLVCDAKFRCLGTSELVTRHSPYLDQDGFAEAVKAKKLHTAELHEGLRMRHSAKPKRAEAMREHNKRVLNGEPVTPEGKSELRKQRTRETKAANFGRTIQLPEPRQEESAEEACEGDEVEVFEEPAALREQDFEDGEDAAFEQW